MSEQTAEDIQAQLDQCRPQLEVVLRKLASDPKNEELLGVKMEMTELIELLEEMLQAKLAEEGAQRGPKRLAASSFSGDAAAAAGPVAAPFAAIARPDFIQPSSRVRARFPADGQYREAYVLDVRAAACLVKFEGKDVSELLPFSHIKPWSAGTTDAVKKRTYVAKNVELDDDGRVKIPEHLVIRPTDTEEEKATKKKKIHLLKSTVRHDQLEQANKAKQNTWQKFQGKKAVTKAVRKDSIFRSSDAGRVGVTGSGKPMTDFTDRSTFRQLAHTQISLPPADE